MTITASAFLDRLDGTGLEANGTYLVASNGITIPLRVTKRSDSGVVIFTFQGSIDRAKTETPIYGTDIRTLIPDATIIGISDPAWEVFPTISSGWYAGWEGAGARLRDTLSALLRGMIDALGGIRRVILQGSSAGGFAALSYGATLPGSIVIALNPQTNLDRYDGIGRYRAACWPNLVGSLSQVITSDLVTRYRQSMDNTVIYLQNPTDTHHVTEQCGPFLAGLPLERYARIALRTPWVGKFGHVSVPTAQWIPWVRAAMDAPDVTARAIQATRNG